MELSKRKSTVVPVDVTSQSSIDPVSTVEPQFLYGTLLFSSLVPPLLIVLAFCGKPGLIALCFGSMFAYIFDVIGAMEATILTVAATLMALWGTIIFSGKNLIFDTIFNMPIIFVLSTMLLLVFFTVAGNFRMLLMEFDTFFSFIETVLFSLTPLYGSCIITWFLCVELPMVDLSLCFSTTYFLYLSLLTPPRVSSLRFSKVSKSDSATHIIPLSILIIMYILPVVASPVLHIALHFHVPIPTYHRIADLLVSLLYPMLLSCYLAERHIDYWVSEEAKNDLRNILPIMKMVLCSALLVAVQGHPIFDDIKLISGLGDIRGSIVTTLACFTVMIGVYLRQQVELSLTTAGVGDMVSASSSSMTIFLQRRMVTLCCMASVYLACTLVGMSSWQNIAVVLCGAVGICEYYMPHRPSRSWRDYLVSGAIILSSALAIALSVLLLASNTLQFLDFSLVWFNIEIPIQFVTFAGCGLSALAVLVPSLFQRPEQEGGILGKHVEDSAEDLGVSNDFGNILFVIFSFFVSLVELLIREQNWVASGATSEVVYPVYLLTITATALILTSLHLVAVNVAGYPLVWFTVVIHCSKMLHLLGVPSPTIFATAALVLTFTLAFTLHAREGWVTSGVLVNPSASGGSSKISVGRTDNGVDFGGDGVWLPQIGYIEGTCYLLLTASASHLSCDSVLPLLLGMFQDRAVQETQVYASALSMWFFYAALQSFVFWRDAGFLRSLLCMMGGGFLLIAGEALGPLVIQYDPSELLLFTFEFRVSEGAVSHSGVFLMIAAILSLAAFAGIFPVQRTLPRLLFLLLFSYCAARCAYEYIFPEIAMGSSVSLDKGSFSFPWLLCLISVFLATSTVLHSTSSSSHATSANIISTVFNSIFFAALILVFLVSEDYQYLHNILWLGGFVHAGAVVCCQILDFSRAADINAARKQTAVGRPFSESLSIASSHLGFLFLASACIVTPHVVCDFYVPLSSLLLMAIPRDLVLFKAHPILISGIFSSAWWSMSAFYSLFLKGKEGLEYLHSFSSEGSGGVFSDAEVSVWSSAPTWIVWGHVFLFMCTLPAIVVTLMKRPYATEDVLFFLAIVSVLPVIAAQIWSIRLLGIVGALFAAWGCYDVSSMQRVSNAVL